MEYLNWNVWGWEAPPPPVYWFIWEFIHANDRKTIGWKTDIEKCYNSLFWRKHLFVENRRLHDKYQDYHVLMNFRTWSWEDIIPRGYGIFNSMLNKLAVWISTAVKLWRIVWFDNIQPGFRLLFSRETLQRQRIHSHWRNYPIVTRYSCIAVF